MARTNAGDMVSRLFLDARPFQRGIGEADAAARGFAGSVGGAVSSLRALGPAIAGSAVVAGLGRMAQAMNEAAEAATRLENRAVGVGLDVEEFQTFTNVFQQFNADADDVNDAFNEINVKLGDAAAGMSGVTAAFEALNIPIRDAEGNLRRNVDVWDDMIGAVQRGGDAATTNAVDAILGGDLARRILPLLQQTRDEYQLIVDDARAAITPGETIAILSEQHRDNLAAAAERQADLNRAAEALEPELDRWRGALNDVVDLLADAAEWYGRIAERPSGLDLAAGPREARRQFIRLNAAIQQGRVDLEEVAALGPELAGLADTNILLFSEDQLSRLREIKELVDALFADAEEPVVKDVVDPDAEQQVQSLSDRIDALNTAGSGLAFPRALQDAGSVANQVRTSVGATVVTYRDLRDVLVTEVAPAYDLVARRGKEAAEDATVAWEALGQQIAQTIVSIKNGEDALLAFIDLVLQLRNYSDDLGNLFNVVGGGVSREQVGIDIAESIAGLAT